MISDKKLSLVFEYIDKYSNGNPFFIATDSIQNG